ncbi:hypothetical protein ACFYOD_37530 [Streptomyces sp. NPDC006703]|uniref:hypothetical protein n=1 Tax=Streptomyces sp. NPDC006703 TaxID=3364759 RepID=UPI00368EEF10
MLTRALTDPAIAAHLRRAVIAEPGPMDGPTARMAGQKGRPSARGIAPAMTGPRSTHLPRYAVAFGLMRLGLLSPDKGLVGQAEGDNAFAAADPSPSAPPQASASSKRSSTLLADNPAVRRTQYMPGVGHHMWNGLGDNDQRPTSSSRHHRIPPRRARTAARPPDPS